MIVANARNGLIYPHDEVCYFMSAHGQAAKIGYFRMDSMPWSVAIAIATGDRVEIVDATPGAKPLTDGLKFGVPTWCLVYNRAIHRPELSVCSWETPHMRRLAQNGVHRKTAHALRKLLFCVTPEPQPAIVGQNVILTCHQRAYWDDKPEILRALLESEKP